MGMFSFEGVSSRDKVLIHQFVDKYYNALSLIKARKYDDGKTAYTVLLDIFKQMNQKESLEEIHKQLAYNCVNDVYTQLSQMEVNPLTDRTFKTLLSITIIIILIGLLLFLKPDIAGMFSTETSVKGPTWIAGLNTFVLDSTAKFNLDEFFIGTGELGYTAMGSEGADVVAAGNILVVVPKPGFAGETTVNVIAYYKASPQEYTKVPLRFVVR